MRFYNRQYRHYCGIDLHVKTLYVCILEFCESGCRRRVEGTGRHGMKTMLCNRLYLDGMNLRLRKLTLEEDKGRRRRAVFRWPQKRLPCS